MAKLIVVNPEPWQRSVLLSDASLRVVVCVCSGQCIPSLFLFALPSCSSRDRGESGPAVRLPTKPDSLARLQFSSPELCVWAGGCARRWSRVCAPRGDRSTSQRSLLSTFFTHQNGTKLGRLKCSAAT